MKFDDIFDKKINRYDYSSHLNKHNRYDSNAPDDWEEFTNLPKDALNVLHVLEKHIIPKCSQICDIYRNTSQYLIRGVGSIDNRHAPSIIHAAIRTDRRRMDDSFSNAGRAMLDKAYHAMGIKSKRSNSLFTVSSQLTYAAGGYGPAYIVFPTNGFQYSWMSAVKGITFGTRALRAAEDEQVTEVVKALTKAGLTNQGLQTVLSQKKKEIEVLVSGKAWYGVDVRYEELVRRALMK